MGLNEEISASGNDFVIDLSILYITGSYYWQFLEEKNFIDFLNDINFYENIRRH